MLRDDTVQLFADADVVNAQRHLATAERSAKLWEGTAWQAATAEARAHIAAAAGDVEEADRQITAAAQGFALAGQPLDAARCWRFLRSDRVPEHPI